MAQFEIETLYADDSPAPARAVVTAQAAGENFLPEPPERAGLGIRLGLGFPETFEAAVREIVPPGALDEGELAKHVSDLRMEVGRAGEAPDREEGVYAVRLAECFCCSAPVYAPGEVGCHECMGATLDTAGLLIPEEVGAPAARGHKWAECKACNRTARRAIKAVIRREQRGRNVGRQLKKKKARARAPR